MELILLVLGIAGLCVGTEVAIKAAVGLAERYHLSHGFVGLTILAVGTDLPELVVAVSGGLMQLRGVAASGIVVGNAVGSAVTQGSLVLGIAALVGPLRIAPTMVRREGMVLLLSVGLLGVLSWDGQVTRLEGAALTLAYLIYYAALVQNERERVRENGEPAPPGGARREVVGILLGMTAVVLSAQIAVENAVAMAERWGVSQTLIGVLLIGAGTSLPELALSVRAAAARHASLSVGNVVGSNIFDLLVPVGASAAIHPLVVHGDTLWVDLPVLTLATLLALFVFLRGRRIRRAEAIALVTLYAAYAAGRIALEAYGPLASG